MARRTVVGGVMAVTALVFVGCGGQARTVTLTTTTPATTQTQLPYDAEENAFMGNFDPNDDNKDTGCFTLVGGNRQEACDCAYRRLRAEGHAASELAAVASGITTENHLPVNVPAWLARTATACYLQQP